MLLRVRVRPQKTSDRNTPHNVHRRDVSHRGAALLDPLVTRGNRPPGLREIRLKPPSRRRRREARLSYAFGRFDRSAGPGSLCRERAFPTEPLRRTAHDHEIRQPVRRPCRHGRCRLWRRPGQRPPLSRTSSWRRVFDKAAGDGAADGPARLQHLLDGRAPFPARRLRVHPQRADDGGAPRACDQAASSSAAASTSRRCGTRCASPRITRRPTS